MGLLEYFSLNGKYYSKNLKDIKYNKRKNFVEYRNEIFYNYGINKINYQKKEYKESLDILNNAFQRNYKLIKIDYNWYFHFYEILINCFYLTFIDCASNLDPKDNLSKNINNFLNFYEYKDYYLNFIDLDGAFMNRSRLINMNLRGEEFDYEKFNEKRKLRQKLLDKSIYGYMTKNGIKEITLLKYNSDDFLLKEENESQINKDIIFDNKDKSNSLFLNNMNDINYYLKRFLFDGYDDKKNSSTEDYY